jgi:thiamine biosynthesis lipoprotein
MHLNKAMEAQSVQAGMGTVIVNKVFGAQAKKALRAAQKETVRLESLLSRYIPDSEISRINQLAGTGFAGISPDTYELLSQSIEFSKRCRGCFDITIGPLADLWANAGGTSAPPEKSKIRRLISLVKYSELLLNSENRTAGLLRKGQSLDLGGIGKGFAADKILEVYKSYGVTSAYTNFGGNVAAIGAKPNGTPWRIGIRHPRQQNGLIGVISVTGRTVVTSGDYQRFFLGDDGKRYHHILDPSTGYPSESGLISVTIIAENSMTADALSTILFIAGMEKGLELLKGYPATEALFIDTNLNIYITKGLQKEFQPNEGLRIRILDQEGIVLR